jgi:iron complex transport system substrate-binding protein
VTARVKWQSFLLVIVLVFFPLAVVYSSEGDVPQNASSSVSTPSQAVTVTDFRGKRISLPKPAQRIVCLIESALSGLFMLDAQDRVVGVSSNVYQGEVYPYYAAMDRRIAERSLSAPGNWDFVNMERVVALEPDLVLIWSHQEESIRALEERSIPVFGIFIRTIEDLDREMRALGALTGTSARAEELIRFTREELLRIQQLTAGESHRTRVYYMWAQGELETSGAGSTVDELIRLAGGTNVCGTIDQEHLVVNIERVLQWDPEVIVMWFNERRDPEDVLALPLWQGVSAVRNGRVHELPGVFACDLWTFKYQLAVKVVAKWCHPELFENVNLEQEREYVFSRLYGAKYSSSALVPVESDARSVGNR